MSNVIRFPSRVTGAMRLPDPTIDPLDYPNEGGLPCDCEPRETATVIALPVRRHVTLFDMCFHFFMLSCAIVYLCYRH